MAKTALKSTHEIQVMLDRAIYTPPAHINNTNEIDAKYWKKWDDEFSARKVKFTENLEKEKNLTKNSTANIKALKPVSTSAANALDSLDAGSFKSNAFIDYAIAYSNKKIEAIESDENLDITSNQIFNDYMNKLTTSFRCSKDKPYVKVYNSLFPHDHTTAIKFKQRTQTKVAAYETTLYTPINSADLNTLNAILAADNKIIVNELGRVNDGDNVRFTEKKITVTENECVAEFWVELEKAIAIFRTVAKCKVPVSHLAKVNGENKAMTHTDDEFMLLSDKQKARLSRRAHEAVALSAGLIGGNSGNARCSYAAKNRRSKQLIDQANWLEKKVAFSAETGKWFKLAGTSDKRKNRLSEMFTMMKGIEKLIKTCNLEWAGVVVTAPPHMHPNPSKGKNSWDGTLPHEVAKWLSEGWAQIRARLAKFNITLSGGWFRESNQDATPHVNFFLVFNHGDYREVARAFKEVFGHSKKAVKIMLGEHPEAIKALKVKGKEPARFATYAMKYFMKAFDGWGVDDISDSEETTAAAFAYRRHGTFGLPAIATWRELRRLRECPNELPLLAAAWRAAHRGDAAEWIMLSGGLACRRSARPIQPWREVPLNCEQSQVVGVKVAEATEIMFQVFDYWKYESQGEVQEVENDAAYTKVHRIRIYKNAVQQIALGDVAGMHVRTRTPGQWKIISEKDLPAKPDVDLSSIANDLGISKIDKVTVKVNGPRKAEEVESETEKSAIIHENPKPITNEERLNNIKIADFNHKHELLRFKLQEEACERAYAIALEGRRARTIPKAHTAALSLHHIPINFRG